MVGNDAIPDPGVEARGPIRHRLRQGFEQHIATGAQQHALVQRLPVLRTHARHVVEHVDVAVVPARAITAYHQRVAPIAAFDAMIPAQVQTVKVDVDQGVFAPLRR